MLHYCQPCLQRARPKMKTSGDLPTVFGPLTGGGRGGLRGRPSSLWASGPPVTKEGLCCWSTGSPPALSPPPSNPQPPQPSLPAAAATTLPASSSPLPVAGVRSGGIRGGTPPSRRPGALARCSRRARGARAGSRYTIPPSSPPFGVHGHPWRKGRHWGVGHDRRGGGGTRRPRRGALLFF